MIYSLKCNYCKYKGKKEAIIDHEDWSNYIVLLKTIHYFHTDYVSIKVHMGIKHKGLVMKYEQPTIVQR